MNLRLVRHAGARNGWARPAAWLGLATMELIGLALLAACGAPAATPSPTPLHTTTSTPTASKAISEGADVGKLAYDFSVVGISNRQVVTRESLRADGKPYILYFFASW